MPGLQFRKLDLHIHTPASRCYLTDQDSPSDIVQAALKQNLSAIAITDHNTAAWVDAVKSEAKNTPLVVFPGVEITSSEGYHIVALFDPSVDQKHIENLLGAVGIQPTQFAHSETSSGMQLSDICDQIHGLGGLAVLAHIDAPKGAFREMSKAKPSGSPSVPSACYKLFNTARYDAVECVDGGLPAGFDSAHHFTRFPAHYQGSDNPDPAYPSKHSARGIGSKFSYFKLDSIDAEGLRQCFEDPIVRIVPPEELPVIGYPRVISMTIGQGGFLGGEVFRFHPGLNSIIGGKGVGKSLAVEFLRFGLSQPTVNDELAQDHTRKLDARLGCGNHVDIVYETADGAQYSVHSVLTAIHKEGGRLIPTCTTECTNIASSFIYSGDVARILPVLAYSQSEVIRIAENKSAQLELVDRFIDTSAFDANLTALGSALNENDHAYATAIYAKDQLESLEKQIATLDELIVALDRQLADPVFDRMKSAEAKHRSLNAGVTFSDKVSSLVQSWHAEAEALSPESVSDSLLDDSDVQRQAAAIENARAYLVHALDSLAATLTEHFAAIASPLNEWLPVYQKTKEAYLAFLKKAGNTQQALEDKRQHLTEQKHQLAQQAHGYRTIAAELELLRDKREVSLDQLEQLYRARFEQRNAKYLELTKLSDGRLRLELAHAQDRTAYAQRLSTLLRGGTTALSGPDRDKIAASVLPRRLVHLVLEHNATELAEEANLTLLWAQRAVERLWAQEDFEAVLNLPHQCFPGDVPAILYNKGGGKFDELANLSVGQKCTALLIIALCDGTMPVVIDQPEDALDIVSVWEDIAVKLRRNKNERQFILTTHNSSVAVAADSDQFIVLEAGADHGHVTACGAIDLPNVRDAVVAHLEGGSEPYKLRAAKYNLIPRR